MSDGYYPVGKQGLTLHLVGLGDVGGTLLTGLVLLGQEIDSIGIYDPDERRLSRYEQEMNQILPVSGHHPRVKVLQKEELFEACDLFAFTASAGVPPVGSGVADVRMVQFEKNRSILHLYVEMALGKMYKGLFFQISDPVDRLCMASSEMGLDPGQIIGCGLGVMAARADYYARKRGITDFLTRGRVYGPHGEGLIAANAIDEGYDDALSLALTQDVISANLAVRETGYKPYIAPGLSSACLTILRALRGEWFYGSVFHEGLFMGRRMKMTVENFCLEPFPKSPRLMERINETMERMRAWKMD